MKNIDSSETFVSVTDNGETMKVGDSIPGLPKGVFIGSAKSYEFFDGESWVAFNNCVAGSVLPISPVGARVSGGAAPTAGDIVFLY